MPKPFRYVRWNDLRYLRNGALTSDLKRLFPCTHLFANNNISIITTFIIIFKKESIKDGVLVSVWEENTSERNRTRWEH